LISEETQSQLKDLVLKPDLPLVISDVDDVVVHFLQAFERYLEERELWLDPASFALTGNVRRKSDQKAIAAEELAAVIASFFTDMTRHLDLIDQAAESLAQLSGHANVVLLTNAPHTVGEDRRSNLLGHGLSFPVITNSGPKGPAIKALHALSNGRTVFIDDSPSFLKSAYDWAPEARLVHFMHDDRFRRHVRPMDFVGLHASSWREAAPFILDALRAA
jgi:hypothetical protein